ncbi:MAG: hypothetical protein LBD53_00690 [Tannerella sp.]|jgi:hypothetical protein|nr:hypothetical protein [Tannerella sp.]
MKRIIYFPIVAVVAITLAAVSGCAEPKGIAGYYTYKTECLGSELDGSVTVLAWGNGRDRFDAGEQARKNAVNDVLFKGIVEGKGDCHQPPLVNEPNARTKYGDYFNKFFADRGLFGRYVSLKDERSREDREIKAARKSITMGVVVRVERAKLKERLIKDGILKR